MYHTDIFTRNVISVTKQSRTELMAHNQVVGHGITKDNGQLKVLVIVKNQDIISELPSSINGIDVKYIVGNGVKRFDPFAVDPEKKRLVVKVRPIRPGIAISSIDSGIGTLGAIGYGPNNERIIITNNHVLAFVFRSDIKLGYLGESIFQPVVTPYAEHKVGYLKGFQIADSTWYGADLHYIDASYAIIDEKMPIEETSMGGFVQGSSSVAILDDEVKKYGLRTAFTEGKITAVDVDIKDELGIFIFKDQILSDIHGDHGDSGSAIIRKSDNSVLGLLWGGVPDSSGKLTLKAICDAYNIEKTFNIRFGINSPPVDLYADKKWACDIGGPILDINDKYTTHYDTYNEAVMACSQMPNTGYIGKIVNNQKKCVESIYPYEYATKQECVSKYMGSLVTYNDIPSYFENWTYLLGALALIGGTGLYSLSRNTSEGDIKKTIIGGTIGTAIGLALVYQYIYKYKMNEVLNEVDQMLDDEYYRFGCKICKDKCNKTNCGNV